MAASSSSSITGGERRKFAVLYSSTNASDLRAHAAARSKKSPSKDDSVFSTGSRLSGAYESLELRKRGSDAAELLVEYERLVREHHADIERDPLRELLVLPTPDVIYETIPRKLRTSVKTDGLLHPYMRDVLDAMTCDWRVVERKYAESSLYPNFKGDVPQRADELVDPIFEIDLDDEDEGRSPSISDAASDPGKDSDAYKERRLSVKSIFKPDSSSSAPESSPVTPQTPKNSMLQDLLDGPVSTALGDVLLPTEADEPEMQILEFFGDHQDKRGKANATRHKLFRLYTEPDSSDSTFACDPYALVEPYRERFGRRLLVELVDFDLKFGLVEPFFGSMTLVDMSTKKRISETFHFDCNPPHVALLIAKHFPPRSSPAPRAAVFPLPNPSTDVWLVIRIEKVLEGNDIASAADRYINLKVKNAKENAVENCDRLGMYRQPFIWTAVQVFNDKLELDMGISKKEGSDDAQSIGSGSAQAEWGSSYIIRPLFRQEDDKVSDEDMYSMLASQKKTSTKKLKTIPGHLEIRLSEVNEDFPLPTEFEGPNGHGISLQSHPASSEFHVLNSSLLPIDTNTPGSNHPLKAAKEIQEFHVHPPLYSQLHFVNTLYIYPLSANLNNAKGRNVALKVFLLAKPEEGASLTEHALPLIYGRSNEQSLIKSCTVAVLYHQKIPSFYEEIKIKLPLQLSSSFHLLFVFYHVSCKKGSGPVESEIGYAFLPIFPENRILNDGHYEVPIAAGLVGDYVVDDSQCKYFDSKKSLFSVKAKVVSTIFTQDAKLNHFFAVAHNVIPNQEYEVISALQDLHHVKPEELFKFSAVVLDELFLILCRGQSSALSKEVFKELVNVVAALQNHQMNKNLDLVAYIKFRLYNRAEYKKPLYEELCRFWCEILKDKDCGDMVMYSWFFFDSIAKTALLHFATRVHSGVSCRDVFSSEFLRLLHDLIPEITKEIHRLCKSKLVVGKEANEALSSFLLNCFAFFEKGQAMKLIHLHLEEFSAFDSENAVSIKFDFLRTICGYEHYVQLNLPLQSYLSNPIDKISSILKDFKRRYCLAGTLLKEVQLTLEESPSDMAKFRALHTIRDLFAKHELDPRYQRPDMQERIANMYFPYIVMMSDMVKRLLETGDDSLSSLQKRQALLSFLYIVKYSNAKILLDWLRRDGIQSFLSLVDVLRSTLESFEYPGKDKITSSKSTPANDLKRYMENVYKSASVQKASVKDWRSIRVQTGSVGRASSVYGDIRTSQVDAAKAASTLPAHKRFVRKSFRGREPSHVALPSVAHHEVKLQGNFCNEVVLLTLDVYDILVEELRAETPPGEPPNKEKLKKLFDYLCCLLSKHLSQDIIFVAFESLKNFIHLFSRYILHGGRIFVSEITRLLLRYLCSPLSLVRERAAGLLYLLLRKNFDDTGNNFSRTRIQTTVALSLLSVHKEKYLRRGLATLREYAARDNSPKHSQFCKLVDEFVLRLFNILRDMVKMHAHREDHDMMTDMQYRIAKGYMNAPDLRLANLEKLGQLHALKENHAEEAMCTLHMAAMVAEYNHIRDPSLHRPKGAGGFRHCSPNIVQESALAEEAGSLLDDDGAFQSPMFEEQGLIELLERSFVLLEKAHLYETANEVYKLTLPIYERGKDYTKLAAAHGKLRDIFESIIAANSSNKRILGTFYRVSFHGTLFEDYNGKEFVYKERKVTQLSEIVSRLESIYFKKFGINFELIQDSKIDKTKLDPSKAYVQVTFVEPYFDKDELKERSTYFERMNNVDRFVFETPYTLTGKSQGTIEEQHKLKTIVRTKFPFPYLLKRIEVVKREEYVLTPLQVAMEMITDRCAKLKAAVETRPVDAKNIQWVLQGSVRLQVNQGPLEIANVFLAPEHLRKYPEDGVRQLRAHFREFVRLCGVAVAINRMIIKPDQKEFQESLEEGFEDMHKKLAPFMNPNASDQKDLIEPEQVSSVLSFISGNSEIESFLRS